MCGGLFDLAPSPGLQHHSPPSLVIMCASEHLFMCVPPLGCLSLHSLVAGSRLTLYVSDVCVFYTHMYSHLCTWYGLHVVGRCIHLSAMK